jgi:hypothetical protein
MTAIALFIGRTSPLSPDGLRKRRTDPESAAARREFIALVPPAIGVLRTPSGEHFVSILCRRPNASKSRRDAAKSVSVHPLIPTIL